MESFCVSIASILRCYTSYGSELEYTLLILPVALQLVFEAALIFTNMGKGRRHYWLVGEGLITFILSLLEVLSHIIPAAQVQLSVFRPLDQTIGALSFLQLFFYMSFLYVFIHAESKSAVPMRFRRIMRLLLIALIPAAVASNFVASFVGVSYLANPLQIGFPPDPPSAHFARIFFSSLTLALLTLFQVITFVLAFARLILAFISQKDIEDGKKDAVVLFRGIGWVCAGLLLGLIESVVGYVCFGIDIGTTSTAVNINVGGVLVDGALGAMSHRTGMGLVIAYVRRGVRTFGRACLCIGVVKGIDEIEDFNVIERELKLSSQGLAGGRRGSQAYRRSLLAIRHLISNPRLSTFRQLSPDAAISMFQEKPRAAPSPSPEYEITTEWRNSTSNNPILSPTADGKPHPYAGGYNSYLVDGGNRGNRYVPAISIPDRDDEAGRKWSLESRTPNDARVTVHFHRGTPKLEVRLSGADLPVPSPVAVRHGRSAFLAQSPLNSAGYAGERNQEIKSKDLDESLRFRRIPASGPSHSQPAYAQGYGQDGTASASSVDAPPAAYFLRDLDLPPPTRNFNRFSTNSSSGYSTSSATQAEIVTAKQTLSQRLTLARAVLLPTPPTKVALALTGDSRRSRHVSTKSLSSIVSAKPAAASHPPQALSTPTPPQNPSSLTRTLRGSVSQPNLPIPKSQRESFFDKNNVVTAVAITSDEPVTLPTGSAMTVAGAAEATAALPDGSRAMRALSGYSVRSRSLPEALQAVRELAHKFPELPLGAVVADIGIRAPFSMAKSTSEGKPGAGVRDSGASTDVEEIVKNRIPAELKGKGVAHRQEMPQLVEQDTPTLAPTPKQRGMQIYVSTSDNAMPRTIDPFGEDETDFPSPVTALHTKADYPPAELSPLSMSVKLRHPMSLISNISEASTRRNSRFNTYPPSPLSASRFSDGSQADGSGFVDLGTALTKMVVRERPQQSTLHSSSENMAISDDQDSRHQEEAQVEIEREQEKLTSVLALQHQSQHQQSPSQSIKSVGKAPRRRTPTPTQNSLTRGSLHLQPLTLHPDVPISALVSQSHSAASRMDESQVEMTPEEYSAVPSAPSRMASALTDSTLPSGEIRLSTVDGGHVPVHFQARRRDIIGKGSYL